MHVHPQPAIPHHPEQHDGRSQQAGDRGEAERPAWAEGIRYPANERRAEGSAADEDSHVQRHHAAAHLGPGRGLHVGVRRGHERERRQADQGERYGESCICRHDCGQRAGQAEQAGAEHDESQAGAAAAGSEQRADDGADGHDRAEQAELCSPLTEFDGGHGGREDGEVEAEGSDQKDRDHDDDDVGTATHVTEAGQQLSALP